MDRLFTASKSGDLDELKKYFANGLVDVEIEDESGKTFLMHACEYGHLKVVKYLLDHHADMDATDSIGMTSLMHACSHGHLPIVKHLLEDRPSVDIEQKDGKFRNALTHASMNGHLPIVKYLVEGWEANTMRLKADSDDYSAKFAVTKAAKYNHVPVVEYLLEHMKSENSEESELARGKCMKRACSRGNIAVVDFLIDGNDFTKQRKSDLLNSAFTDACQEGQLSLVKHLVEEKCTDGIPPYEDVHSGISEACESNHLPILKYFFEEKNFEMCEEDMKECFYQACRSGHLPIVQYFIEDRNLDVDADLKGAKRVSSSCLMEACDSGSLPLVKYFVEERHASVDAIDSSGMTVLMHACVTGALPVVRYLVEEKNVTLETKDDDGETCLTHAESAVSEDVVNYLIYECLMDFPGVSLSINPDHSEEAAEFVESYCSSAQLLKQRRYEGVQNMRHFLHRKGLQEEWHAQQESTFLQNLPLRIQYEYQFIETKKLSSLSDLKVYFGKKGNSDEDTRTVVYSCKENLSKSCTFMENLLTGEMNDVKDDPDDPGMQMVELSQDLLQDCPEDFLKQLIIFLSWSKDGDRMEHYVTDAPPGTERTYSFPDFMKVLRYYRTVKALGIEISLSGWLSHLSIALERYNIQWIPKARDGNALTDFIIRDVTPFGTTAFDLWTHTLGEVDDLYLGANTYFFMLVNACKVSRFCPTSIAPKCHQWLRQNVYHVEFFASRFKEALCNEIIAARLNRSIGYDVKTGSVSISVSEAEKFVKRKRRRIGE